LKMNVRAMRHAALAFGVMLFIGSIKDFAIRPAPQSESSISAACRAPQYRQFNFWLGDWDVFDVGSPARVAQARITSVMDGCAVREQYDQNDGTKGESFSSYNASTGTWRQSWVTNHGHSLVIEGKLEGGEMVLTGDDPAAGPHTLIRGIWKLADGGVCETAVTSTDGGKKWKPLFDLMFRRAAATEAQAGAPESEDEKEIAELDERFQAAVKKNDVATMSHLLADNFILVTGSGEVETKADLLREARSGVIHYQHQEDSERTVRVYGDTAVVTAKLWGKGTENLLTLRSGSATRTCAPRRDGDTSSAKRRCPCGLPNPAARLTETKL
jgi:ketosteroid isomerase-like protein